MCLLCPDCVGRCIVCDALIWLDWNCGHPEAIRVLNSQRRRWAKQEKKRSAA